MITFTRVTSQVESPADAALFLRMLFWAHTISALKHIVALPALVRMMRRPPQDRVMARPDVDDRECERIATLARWACQLVPWQRRGTCLERSLLIYRYLSRSGADLRLVVGFNELETADSRAHAWVQVRHRPLGEDLASLAPYTPVLAFDAAGQLVRDASRPAA